MGWAVSNVAFDQTILKEYSNCKLAAVTFFLFVITLPVSSCLPCTQRVYVFAMHHYRKLVVLGCLYFATGVTIGVVQSAFIIAPYVLFQVHTVPTYCSEKEGGNSVNGLVTHFFP